MSKYRKNEYRKDFYATWIPFILTSYFHILFSIFTLALISNIQRTRRMATVFDIFYSIFSLSVKSVLTRKKCGFLTKALLVEFKYLENGKILFVRFT